MARLIRTDNVSINNVLPSEGNPALSLDGVNKSGFERYKGEFGFHAFSHIKSIPKDGNSVNQEANWFPYTREKYRIFSRLTQVLSGPGRLLPYALGAFHGLRLETYVNRLRKQGRPRPLTIFHKSLPFGIYSCKYTSLLNFRDRIPSGPLWGLHSFCP